MNGAQAGTPYTYASEATGGSAGDLYIGWDNEYLDGKVDEPRVAASARSADWIAAQYASQTDAFISYATPEQKAGVLDNDSDAEAGALTATLESGPSNAASFVLNPDGTFSYTPNADFNGVDSFTYRANDGTDASAPATVTITVNPVNDAPGATIASASFAVMEDTPLALHGSGLSMSDVDAATGNVVVTLSVGEGTLTVAAGTNTVAVTGSGTASVTLDGEVDRDPGAPRRTQRGQHRIRCARGTGREHDADTCHRRPGQHGLRRLEECSGHRDAQHHRPQRCAQSRCDGHDACSTTWPRAT